MGETGNSSSLIKPSPGVIGLANLCGKAENSPYIEGSFGKNFDFSILKNNKCIGFRKWHSQPSLSGYRIHCFTCNEQVQDFLKTVHGGCLFNCNATTGNSTFQTPSHGAVGEIKDILYKLEDILT